MVLQFVEGQEPALEPTVQVEPMLMEPVMAPQEGPAQQVPAVVVSTL